MCYSFSPHVFYFGKRSLLNNFQENVVIQSVKALGEKKCPDVSGGLTVSEQYSMGIYLHSKIISGVCIIVMVDGLGKKPIQVLQGRVVCSHCLAELGETDCFQCLKHSTRNKGRAKRKSNLSYMGVT